jgi:hypothetical protein
MGNRYSTIGKYEKMLGVIEGNFKFNNFEELVSVVS